MFQFYFRNFYAKRFLFYSIFHRPNMKVTIGESRKPKLATIVEAECATPKRAAAGRRQSVCIEVWFKFQISFLSLFSIVFFVLFSKKSLLLVIALFFFFVVCYLRIMFVCSSVFYHLFSFKHILSRKHLFSSTLELNFVFVQ